MTIVTNPTAHNDALNRFWNDDLETADPDVAAIIGRELGRQRDDEQHRYRRRGRSGELRGGISAGPVGQRSQSVEHLHVR